MTPANKGANPKEWVDSKIKEEWFTCNSGLGVDVMNTPEESKEETDNSCWDLGSALKQSKPSEV